MRVAFWDERKPFTYIDTKPQADDIVYDVPQNFVERYVKCMDEFFKIQDEIYQFVREQDLRDSRDDTVTSSKLLKFKA